MTRVKIACATRLRTCGFRNEEEDAWRVEHANRAPRDNFVFLAAVAYNGFYASLRHLLLHRHVDDSVVVCLLEVCVAVHALPKLTLLSLSNDADDVRRISHSGVYLLTTTPKAFPRLESLVLSGHAFKDATAIELAFCTETLPTLTTIDLAHNGVGSVGIEALAALEHVHELRLPYNRIVTLPPCKYLRCLHVRHCFLGDPGLGALAAHAKDCARLVELDATHNRYTRAACTLVVHAPFDRLRFVGLDHVDDNLRNECTACGMCLLE